MTQGLVSLDLYLNDGIETLGVTYRVAFGLHTLRIRLAFA